MAYIYGNQDGPTYSLFRTVIEYSYRDLKNGYYRLSYRFFAQVTQGDFYGTNLSTSWGGNVYIYGVGEYNYSGWYTKDVLYGSSITISGSCQYTGGSTYVSSASYKFTAPNPVYSITYNANGGSGSPSKQTYTYANGYINLSSTIPKRTGYEFLGWSLDKNAKTPSYYAGQKWARTNTSNYVLYAVWKLIQFTTIFNAEENGGTVEGKGSVTKTYNYGETYGGQSGVLPIAVKKNYKFVGWNTVQNGSGLTIAQDTEVYSSTTLYAIFELQANCYIRVNGEYKAGMMYKKENGQYKTGMLSIKKNGEYKETNMQ